MLPDFSVISTSAADVSGGRVCSKVAAVLLELSHAACAQPETRTLLTTLHQRAVPVIAVAETFDAELSAHLHRYTISECLYKPFNPALVRLRLRNVIALSRLRHAVAAFSGLSEGSKLALPKNPPKGTAPSVGAVLSVLPKTETREHRVIFQQALELLEQERLKYRMLVELTGDIVFSYDQPSDTLTFSKSYVNAFGSDKSITHLLATLETNSTLHADDRATLRDLLYDGSPEHPQSSAEIRLLINDEYQWFEIHTIALFDADTGPGRYRGCLGRLININARVSETARWRKQASTDPLTGLDNRKCAELRIRGLLEHRRTRGALLFIDLDNFKNVNDTYGHLRGDALLCTAAHILRSCVRTTDIVSRLGGDEFLIFLHPLASVPAITRKAEQLCRAFEGHSEGLLRDLAVSCSIGIALCPEDGNTLAELLEKADKALYQAKAHGKSRFVFYSPDSEQDVFARRAMLETDSKRIP